MRHLLAVDLDAPVLVVVPSIFGVGAQASSSGHALGVDAIFENTLVQDHGAHGLSSTTREAYRASAFAERRAALRRQRPQTQALLRAERARSHRAILRAPITSLEDLKRPEIYIMMYTLES